MQEFTLDRLFRVRAPVDLPNGDKAWVRALSDFELQLRNRKALEASLEAKERVENKESIEYRVSILPLESAEATELAAVLLAYQKSDLTSEAEREFPYEFIPFPDEASSEEELDVIKQRGQMVQDTNAKRLEWAKKSWEAFQEEIARWDADKLCRECIRKSKDAFQNAAYGDAYVDFSVYECTEDDSGERLFRSQDDVRGLPRTVKMAIMSKLREVNDIDPFSLRSQYVTA